jgi:hypothetical protein
MDERTIRSQSDHVQQDALKTASHLQTTWKKVYFDLPLAMLSEAMRFTGQRLQAQSDFFVSLKTCRTVPDVVDAQSTFVRTATDEYGVEAGKVANDVRSGVNRSMTDRTD